MIVIAEGDWFGATVMVTVDDSGGATGVDVPVMTVARVNEIIDLSGAGHTPGSAIFAVRITENGAPVGGAIMENVDGVEPHYDTATNGSYLPGTATSGAGMAVFFDMDPTIFTPYAFEYGRDGTASEVIDAAAYNESLVLLDAPL